MDKSFHSQESNTKQPNSLLTSLWIFDSILLLMRRSVKWRADLIQLTEEEQYDAGIHLGCLRNE